MGAVESGGSRMRAAKVWGLWIVLALGLVLAWAGPRLPPPSPDTAPADAFSAERAMADVQLVGARPHPTGSAENARVRAQLLLRMAALGLSPQVHDGVGVEKARWDPSVLAAGSIHDLLAVLPGRDRSLPAVVLMAHYDSVLNSPGAADDAAVVATALETVRALAATGPHLRDTMVLITDGEEAGLLGAEAFLHGDPAAAHIGVVLNMEARGDAGPAAMFETGQASGALTDLYGRVAKHPNANSVASFVYHLLPNDTDFTHVRNRGLPGLNFAFAGDQLAYHTPLATPGHLSRASLQNMGDQVWPTARALADAPQLPARRPDRVYSDLFGGTVVSYPPAAGWLVVLAAAALLAFAAWRAHRDGRFVAWQAVRGVAMTVAATAAAALALQAAGVALGSAGYIHQYHLLARPGLLFAGAAALALGFALLMIVGARRGDGILQAWAGALLCFLIVCIGEGRFDGLAFGLDVAVAVFGGLALWRSLPLWGGWIGALVVSLLLAVAMQARAPLAAMLFSWPALLGAASAAGAAAFGKRGAVAAGAVVGSVAVIALAWLGGWALQVFVLVGAATPMALALFVPLLLPTLHPLAAAWGKGRRKRAVAFGLVLAGTAALACVNLLASPPARPDLTQALAYAEPAAGVFRRVSALPKLDAWSREVLQAGGARPVRTDLVALSPSPVWAAPAPAFAATPPRLTLAHDGSRLALTAAPTRGGQRLTLLLRSPGGVSLSQLQGREVQVSAAPGRWLRIVYEGPPPTGVALVADASGPVEAVAAEVTEGWPAGTALAAKPVRRMAWGLSDHTVVAARATVR